MSITWEKNLKFDEVTTKISNYRNKIQEDNGIETFNLDRPKLIFSYILEQDSSRYIDLLQPDDITSIYNQNRNSNSEFQKDKRERIIQLLCVAHKAHYFLYPESICIQKPKIFEYPNFLKIDDKGSFLIYELIYELDNGKTILVSEYNSENRTLEYSTKFSDFIKFPVVLTKSPTNWLNTKKWKQIKEQKNINSNYINVQYDSSSYNNIHKINSDEDFKNFTNNVLLVKKIPTPPNPNHFNMKHICSLLGGFKAQCNYQGHKEEFYYWPYGWDVEGIIEYLNFYENISTADKKYIPPEIKKI